MDVINITPLFILGLKGWQLIVVACLALLIFGVNRIPSIMRDLGKGVHSFKQGIEDAKEEMNKPIKKYNDTTQYSDAKDKDAN